MKHFPRYWPFVRNPPVTDGFPSQRPVMRSFDIFLWSVPEHTVEKTIETPVIWDDIAIIMASLPCVFLDISMGRFSHHTCHWNTSWCDDLSVSNGDSIWVVVVAPSVTSGRQAVYKVSQYRACHSIAISHYISSECKPHTKLADSSCHCPSITGQQLPIMFRHRR